MENIPIFSNFPKKLVRIQFLKNIGMDGIGEAFYNYVFVP